MGWFKHLQRSPSQVGLEHPTGQRLQHILDFLEIYIISHFSYLICLAIIQDDLEYLPEDREFWADLLDLLPPQTHQENALQVSAVKIRFLQRFSGLAIRYLGTLKGTHV